MKDTTIAILAIAGTAFALFNSGIPQALVNGSSARADSIAAPTPVAPKPPRQPSEFEIMYADMKTWHPKRIEYAVEYCREDKSERCRTMEAVAKRLHLEREIDSTVDGLVTSLRALVGE